MAGSFEVINGDLKITFEYQGNMEVVQNIIESASECLYERVYQEVDDEGEPIPFDSLSNNEKLAFIDRHIKQVVLNLANSWKSNKAQRIAREDEAEREYEL